jgi:hypothetical protein
MVVFQTEISRTSQARVATRPMISLTTDSSWNLLRIWS